jgi:hypothetical protein
MSNVEKKRHTSTMEIRLSMQKALKANLSEQARKGLLERRSGKDRRGWGKMPDIPFHDSSGVIVSSDRRVIPERRVSSLQIGWDEQATSASVTVVQNNAGMADSLPEDGLFTNSSELQDELNALAKNMDDLVEDEHSDLMDDSDIDYFDQPSDKQPGK